MNFVSNFSEVMFPLNFFYYLKITYQSLIKVIDFEKAIATHCQRHIDSAIREKLDLRAVRVFRLLMQKGFLEEDHVSLMILARTILVHFVKYGKFCDDKVLHRIYRVSDSGLGFFFPLS